MKGASHRLSASQVKMGKGSTLGEKLDGYIVLQFNRKIAGNLGPYYSKYHQKSAEMFASNGEVLKTILNTHDLEFHR